MKKYVYRLYQTHVELWKKEYFSLITSGLYVLLAFVVQRLASQYVSNVKGVAVNDVFLNLLPALDIDALIIAITLLLTFIVIGLCLIKPRYLTFVVKTASLFIITRAFFISLTHLGSSPHELVFSPENIGYWLYDILYNTHGDFFFSGHTGMPFLMSLIFWREKGWRIFFLIASGVFGLSVLVAHIHYSIDVFAAPFMAYSIFSLARYFFKKDARLAGVIELPK